MRYDDEALVRAYKVNGKLPKIHDAIGRAIAEYAPEHERFVDIGCCFGLLALRALKLGRSAGLCVDASRSSLERAVLHPRLAYHHLIIQTRTLPVLDQMLEAFKPPLAIARRILPEIEQGSPGTVPMLARTLHLGGVRRLILQGRLVTTKATAKLSSVDLEIEAVSAMFKLVHLDGQVAVLDAC